MTSGKSAVDRFLLLEDDALVRQCAVDHYRSSGPGGQKRNKTSSAVRLRHGPTGLVVTAADDRSQHVNKVRAIRRLRQAIALHVRTDVDLAGYRRSDSLASYVTADGTIRISPRNPQYHPVVCELLDLVMACQGQVSEAAATIGVSTSQLVAFFRRDPKLWECVNQIRAEAGVRGLR